MAEGKQQMKVATAAAVEMAGLARHVWDDGLKRREYTQAPPAAKGEPRRYDRDDILAMSLQAQLSAFGLSNPEAWKIAGLVRSELRSSGEDIECLWITCSADGQPLDVVTRRPVGVTSHAVPVAELREKITRLVARRLTLGARN